MHSTAASAKILNAAHFEIAGGGADRDYAARLLTELGATVERSAVGACSTSDLGSALHPALDWAASGAMTITRSHTGQPVLAPCALASCARGALTALDLLNPGRGFAAIDAPALLGERAAISGIPKPERLPTQSCGGSCRLLKTRDAWIAVNLPREEDLHSLPAWVGEVDPANVWECLAQQVAKHESVDLVARARLLGLAVAVAAPPPDTAPAWLRVLESTDPGTQKRDWPLVIDLSALWAGPLCTQLLQLGGARIIKVESVSRPDGARFGTQEFFDLLNADKESVALDFRTQAGRTQLAALIEQADVVIESARPRAMSQLGVDVSALVKRRKNFTWLSITGYGRSGPEANWIAFGDDAAVAAGLAVLSGSAEAPVFCGDAIADPLAGLHAALAAQASWQAGGSRLLDISLCNVAAHAASFAPDAIASASLEPATKRTKLGDAWNVRVAERTVAVAAPRARKANQPARALGADTARVLEEFQIPC